MMLFDGDYEETNPRLARNYNTFNPRSIYLVKIEIK